MQALTEKSRGQQCLQERQVAGQKRMVSVLGTRVTTGG